MSGDLVERLHWVAETFEELDRSQHHDRGSGDFDPSDTEKAKAAISEVIDALRPGEDGPWRCFFCGETFADRHAARLHFGGDEDCTAACQIKASEGGLIKALRDTEEELFKATCAMHSEGGDALRTWAAVGSRHEAALRSAEQTGYERGLADMRASVERLRRIVASYTEKGQMATHLRQDWKIEIEEALRFVADNPEERETCPASS